jgi:hypothetical protein
MMSELLEHTADALTAPLGTMSFWRGSHPGSATLCAPRTTVDGRRSEPEDPHAHGGGTPRQTAHRPAVQTGPRNGPSGGSAGFDECCLLLVVLCGRSRSADRDDRFHIMGGVPVGYGKACAPPMGMTSTR